MHSTRRFTAHADALRAQLEARSAELDGALRKLELARTDLAVAQSRIAELRSEKFALQKASAAAQRVAATAAEPADADVAHLKAALALTTEELKLQKTMLAVLQGERANYAAYLEELEAAGTNSTRLAISRAWRMTVAAIRRRLARLTKRARRPLDTHR